MQKGFKFQRMGERERIWGQISLCSNTCNTGQLNWILSALFHCIRKSILITVVIIPTFSPQYFVRIYSLTLQVVLNAKKCYGEEILHCRLGGQIYIYRLLQLRHFINVPRIYAPLCIYVHMCVCVCINIYIWEIERQLRGNQHYSSFYLAAKHAYEKWTLQNYFS